jgi:hypothetical protein
MIVVDCAVPMQYKVTISNDKISITDAAGNVAGSVKLTEKYTHLMIIAMKEATLLATPRLIFQ